MPRTNRVLAVAFTLLLMTQIAAGPSTASSGVSDDDARWQQAWADLAGPEPAASRALLHFASDPARTLAFFRPRLKPLKLTPEGLEPLLTDLGSDDEAVWKPAFKQLEYLDPRLAMPLVDLMKLVTDYPARGRLVDVVCNVPAGTFTDKDIRLESIGPDDAYNFRGGSSSWWAEVRIDRINALPWSIQKGPWTRANRAIVLLQHFDTPEARAFVADLATGHPDAMPTKLAKDPQARIELPKPK